MHFDRRSMMGGGLALAAAGVPLGRVIAGERAPYINRIALEDDRVWITAKIRDDGPHLFVIDTGGYLSLINEKFATSFGMKAVSARQIGEGIGGKSNYSWYDAGTVTLESGVFFPHMLFVGTHALGRGRAVGSFGVGMFTTYDSDLDFAKGEWRVYKEGRPDFAGLTRLPARFFDQGIGGEAVLARATIDGVPGEFIVDTGASGALHIGGKMTTRSGLWDDTRPYVPIVSRGIGHDGVSGRLVRAKRLSIGSFDFEHPIVNVSSPAERWINSDGLIGLNALSQLNLTTDVSQRLLWAASNGLPQRDPVYPGSGLWFDRDGENVKIGDVGTGSPAAAAGLQRGDRVEGEFQELIRRISAPYGTDVALKVERGGTKREVRLKLAAYL